MADLLETRWGARPWAPTGDPDAIETVLHRYDIPLLGIVRSQGAKHLFRCLVGEVEDVNFWTYSWISDSEAKRLKAEDDPDRLEEMCEEILMSRPAVMALAARGFGELNGLGIVASEITETWTADEAARVGAALIDDLHSRIESMVSAASNAQSTLSLA
jgi:hypothetical protein